MQRFEDPSSFKGNEADTLYEFRRSLHKRQQKLTLEGL